MAKSKSSWFSGRFRPEQGRTATVMTTTSPRELYQIKISSGVLQPDDGQADAVMHLENLFDDLQPLQHSRRYWAFRSIFGFGIPKKNTVKGLYLYGGVGRGKTMLMDMFAKAAKPLHSQRFHFHDFMVIAQNEVQAARQAGHDDPINRAADKLMSGGRIICFDEMEVRDIADAMIIRRLFLAMWDRGMILVTTSNRPPDSLYLDGLHRDRFLPFISDLNTRLNIHEIASGQDWRKMFLTSVSNWHLQPAAGDAAVGRELDQIFSKLGGGAEISCETMVFSGRSLSFERVSGDVVDVSFVRLCGQPLGVRDYLAVADRFSGLILRNIPVLDDTSQNEARRLMWLVDALYDRGRFMIASAAEQVDRLYQGDRWAFEFDRTCSRLREMARLRGMQINT